MRVRKIPRPRPLSVAARKRITPSRAAALRRRNATGSTYLQNRVDNAGIRYLQCSGALTGVADSDQMTFSAWVKRDVVGDQHCMINSRDNVASQSKLLVNFDMGSGPNRIRFRYQQTAVDYIEYKTTLTVADTDWHYIKLVVDLDPLVDEATFTIDDQTEVFAPNSYMLGGGISTFTFSDDNQWRIGTNGNNSDPLNGVIGDVIFSPTILTDAALSYNGGVPLNPVNVVAPIKITGKTAADFEAGDANLNGSGADVFANVGTVNIWTDKQGGTPSYSQNLVDSAGTRYLEKLSALSGLADTDQLTFSAWVKRNAVGVAHTLLSSKSASATTKLLIQCPGTNKIRVRYVHASGDALDWTSVTSVITDTNRHQIKFLIDLTADTGSVTLDGVEETFTPSAFMGGGSVTEFDWTAGVEWRVLASITGATIWNGAIGDLIFAGSILNDASLAYNGGTPLDPVDVVAPIKLYAVAADDYDGTYPVPNGNGTGGAFVQAGSGSWTDV